MNTLFLKWHLGLGDAILCNGMARVLATDYNIVFLPAKIHNAPAVRWMFSDEPRIAVVAVPDDAGMLDVAHRHNAIGIGAWGHRGIQPSGWDRAMYEDAGVPFECRWTDFKLPDVEDVKRLPDYKWAFVHDDRGRHYNMRPGIIASPFGIYFPNREEAFSHHVAFLKSAEEIHVIDSCFLCLADSVETSAKRHVLHAYATAHDPYKKFGPPTLRKNWEILR